MTNQDAIKYLQQLYPNGGHCWLDEQRIEAIGMAVKALQEEPESIWHDANEKSDNPEDIVIINPSDNTGAVLTKCISVYQGRIWAYTSVLLNLGNPCKIRKNIQDESVTKDLGDYINELSKQFPEVSFAKLSRIAVRVAKWQKQQDQSTIELAEDHAYFAGRTKTMDETKEALLSEVLPCFMHGGEADEVVAKLDEVLNKKK